jgi:2,4-dienoyl-CoA reductase (NADPH2)
VDLRLGSEATADAVLADTPDLVVAATGASPEQPDFPVAGGARVATVWDLLGGSVEIPRRALVLDDAVGFWHGVSAAEYLAERGAEVELATPARAVGLAIPHESVAYLHGRLRRAGVRFRPFTTVTGVDGTKVALADPLTGEPSETTADLVVVKTRLGVEDGLVRALDGKVPALVAIGDCAAPRRMNHAVLEANVALRRFEEGRIPSVATTLS